MARDLDWSNVVADGEWEDCGKPVFHDDVMGSPGTMPCWRLPGHDGNCKSPFSEWEE